MAIQCVALFIEVSMRSTLTKLLDLYVAPEPPHAHPAAPPELRKAFPDFLKKFEASASSGASPKKSESGKQAYSEFWEAPSRFWVKELDEAEIDAISVSWTVGI